MTELEVAVRVAAGTRRGALAPAYVVPHAWSQDGIAVEGGGTGAHLLLTAVACCLLNDVYREAGEPEVPVDGVLVEAAGLFDASTWSTTSIDYDVHVDSEADVAAVGALVDRVAEIAEIPRALRGEVRVARR